MKTGKFISLFFIVVLISFIFIGCSKEEKAGPEIRPEWKGFLNEEEQNDLASLVFYKPIGIEEHLRYVQYQYQLGYFTQPIPREEANELSRLETAAIALGDEGLEKEQQFRLFELRYFYQKFSDLSRGEAKELARLLVKYRSNFNLMPVRTSGRVRELLIRSDGGNRTAE